jgi:SagB-type dehydrogenase family enzyme
MTFTAFSNFLALCARDRESPEDTPFISRPYPSGGGIYSLEIYPVLAEQAVESISSGLYRYLPESHRLQKLPAAGAICSSYLESAGASAVAAPPPIVLLITSHFAAQAAIYGGLAYSLILKEVGSLFQTMYLAAEHLHLSGCALGGGISGSRLTRICGTSELAEPLVGEFLLGPR